MEEQDIKNKKVKLKIEYLMIVNFKILKDQKSCLTIELIWNRIRKDNVCNYFDNKILFLSGISL
jgi:hypothetical protein